MFQAKVVDSFSAAHRLRGYQGDCERLHGHNYRVEVTVKSHTLDGTGIVMDFRDLKTLLKKTLDELDHRYLNDLPWFQEQNPSAEHIARAIFEHLSPSIPSPVTLKEVVVWENEACCVSYSHQEETA
ncbi:MAG TPA: 6-carboxytetrahydropterin synthase QueD [Deltaproteobacteria bacterium]|nr:6-carboxytetrahydropterin synthase QueD [Deltaproteobacteria bacterium]